MFILFNFDFTIRQGLTYGNGKLYASTGLYGKSKIRQLDKKGGNIIEDISLERKYFGEGLTLFDDNTKLIQITWKEKTGFIYDTLPNITKVKTFSYSTTRNEGWGITYNPTSRQFIVSDGSAYLHFWDEDTLEETKKVLVVTVTPNDDDIESTTNTSIIQINELEYINGRVFANVWFKDDILIINPDTGIVEHSLDFSTLWPKTTRSKAGADVLNGISVFDNDEILFTGKLWPQMYRIKLNGIFS